MKFKPNLHCVEPTLKPNLHNSQRPIKPNDHCIKFKPILFYAVSNPLLNLIYITGKE